MECGAVADRGTATAPHTRLESAGRIFRLEQLRRIRNAAFRTPASWQGIERSIHGWFRAGCEGAELWGLKWHREWDTEAWRTKVQFPAWIK